MSGKRPNYCDDEAQGSMSEEMSMSPLEKMLRTQQHSEAKTRALMRKFFKRPGREEMIEQGCWEPQIVEKSTIYFDFDYENGSHRKHTTNHLPTVCYVQWIHPFEEYKDKNTKMTMWNVHFTMDLLENPQYKKKYDKEFGHFLKYNFDIVEYKAYKKRVRAYTFVGKWYYQIRQEDALYKNEFDQH